MVWIHIKQIVETMKQKLQDWLVTSLITSMCSVILFDPVFPLMVDSSSSERSFQI
jgi:hypothetical protein